MRRSVMLWLTAMALAAAAAVSRVWEFMSAYIIDTQLTVPLHPATIITVLISAAAVMLMFALREKKEPVSVRDGGQLYFVLEFLACAALLGSAYFDVRKTLDTGSLSLGVFVALTLFAAFAVLLNSRTFGNGKVDFTRGFYLTIPVFWSCYWLVLDFWEHAANPVLFSYFYKMMAIVFVALALHSAAGLCYGRGKVRRTISLAYSGMFFAVMTVLSTILANVFIGSDIPAMTLKPALMCRFIFVALHMSFIGLRAASAKEKVIENAESAEIPETFEDETEEY